MTAIARPTLSDGTLTLRAPRPDDADAVTAACQDPEIPRWTRVPSPYERHHALDWFELGAAEAAAGTTAAFLGFDAAGLAGSFSIMEIDRERGYGEIGYWVSARARGQGIGPRAVRLMCEWAREELGLELIEIFTHRDNRPSQRVAEKAGFTTTGEPVAAPERLEAGPGRDFLSYRWSAA
jgi:RimJ/RimL family protein N-acetyltransferase